MVASSVAVLMCGKFLKAIRPELLASLRRREAVPEEGALEVLRMSAATIDRRLRTAKASCPGRGRRRRPSLDEHRREIPLKVDVWPEAYPKTPGYAEVDTVAHCGGSMAGSFVRTVTTTDVATQWTTLQSLWNKGAAGFYGAISEFIAEALFDVRMLNSDNGGGRIASSLALSPQFWSNHCDTGTRTSVQRVRWNACQRRRKTFKLRLQHGK